MSVEWNRFWCRVLFKEFIKHFRKLNDEQIVKDVRQSMDDLEDLVPDTDSFGSQMVRWSLERADEPFAVAARENGKKGGRPRKDSSGTEEALESQRRAGADSVRGTPSHRAPARQRAPFRNKEDFIQWAIDDGLDPVDAGECWEATEERHGKDADGNTVKNMKAFARQWCRTRKDNRRTA